MIYIYIQSKKKKMPVLKFGTSILDFEGKSSAYSQNSFAESYVYVQTLWFLFLHP